MGLPGIATGGQLPSVGVDSTVQVDPVRAGHASATSVSGWDAKGDVSTARPYQAP